MTASKRLYLPAALLLTAAAFAMAGCRGQEAAGAGAPTPAAAANSAQAAADRQAAMQRVQSDPNIPPQAKAVILNHMQGKGDPAGQPRTGK